MTRIVDTDRYKVTRRIVKLTIPQPEDEQRVLRALQDKLMRKDFFAALIRKPTTESISSGLSS